MTKAKVKPQIICDINTKEYLSTSEACMYLDVSPAILDQWRSNGVEIPNSKKRNLLPYYKMGSRNSMIRYRRVELVNFVHENFKQVGYV